VIFIPITSGTATTGTAGRVVDVVVEVVVFLDAAFRSGATELLQEARAHTPTRMVAHAATRRRRVSKRPP